MANKNEIMDLIGTQFPTNECKAHGIKRIAISKDTDSYCGIFLVAGDSANEASAYIHEMETDAWLSVQYSMVDTQESYKQLCDRLSAEEVFADE